MPLWGAGHPLSGSFVQERTREGFRHIEVYISLSAAYRPNGAPHSSPGQRPGFQDRRSKALKGRNNRHFIRAVNAATSIPALAAEVPFGIFTQALEGRTITGGQPR